MSKNLLILVAILVTVLLWNKALRAQFGDIEVENSTVPVVVELFTSQSCSSCPPADKILGELAEAPNIIALGCHVTYWNHLHWIDSLSHEFCTERQRAYAAYTNSRRVYTPQMVVNGKEEFVGSNHSKTNAAISNAIKSKAVKPIALKFGQSQKAEIMLPAVEKGDYTLWVMGYKKHHAQDIARGENRGRKVVYVNSVITLDTLGRWNGQEKTLSFLVPDNNDIDGLAIIAQENNYGPTVAAGQASL